MALDQIRLGTPPTGTDGDDARTAFTRCNNNFKSLDDWGITGVMTRNITNLNDANQPGWYAALAGGAANLPPGITYAMIFVGVHNAGFVVQEATDVTSGKSATRVFNANGTGAWGDWRTDIAAVDLGSAAFATLTTSVQDATPGRVLRVNDFGIGGSESLFSGNANLINITSSYWTQPGAAGLPTSNYGYLTHVQSPDPYYAKQTWQQLNFSSYWGRVKNGGTWGAWTRINANDNAIGVVSTDPNQSALLEYGGNTNGRYLRFIDGTQICWSWQIPSNSVAPNAFADVNWTMPMPFVDTGYSIQASSQPTQNWDFYGVVGAYNRATGSITMRLRNGASSAQQFLCDITAIGRWR
ncbi:pyocin knob domain-containing protein [Pseudomonas sp. NBRC 111130]|uniref:pyocin knob domain-containing protein n=1 Tax=Pseudomonas sp. NBRC 111130 TaxID=1661045 RepID=UPI0006D42432|nr:pyocin knob domain-containing protein [Pseudomonas sp. NBRC 111130]